MWNNIKLTVKLYAGFGAVLFLLAVLAVISVNGISSLKSNFSEYRQTARTSMALGKFKDHLMETRLNALKHRSADTKAN